MASVLLGYMQWDWLTLALWLMWQQQKLRSTSLTRTAPGLALMSGDKHLCLESVQFHLLLPWPPYHFFSSHDISCPETEDI